MVTTVEADSWLMWLASDSTERENMGSFMSLSSLEWAGGCMGT